MRVVGYLRRLEAMPFAALVLGLVLFTIAACALTQSAITAIRLEAEAGTLLGNTSVISDQTASGGGALAFSNAVADPYVTVPSNFDVNSWLINFPDTTPSSASEPTGSFRMICTFSHLGYMDPIVYPGQSNKGHLHVFFGNKTTDQDSTYQSLRSNGDGTCPGGPINRTGYWMPAVFDANDNNKIVLPSFFNIYYKDAPCPTAATNLAQKQACIKSIHDMPNGLRYIAGYDMNGPTDQPEHHAWYCANNQNKAVTIPSSCAAGDTLLAAIYFPTCWDGVHLDSADHRSHMAYIYYDSNDGQSRCPSTHPVHIPALTEFAEWENPGNTSGWSLSSDHMPGMAHADGSTMHADWLGAWDVDIMHTWIENCIRGMKNANSGNLCNSKQLKPVPAYSGPMRVSGYTEYYR